MPHVINHATAHEFLHTRGKPVDRKKLQNNTYAERRPNGDIAIRLHNTDVVTYHARNPWGGDRDGRQAISLDTGGWLTVTTKERQNAYTPPGVTVASNKGTWEVRIGGWSNPSDIVRYTDGITLVPNAGEWTFVRDSLLPGEDQVRQDRHNAMMRKKITAYLKALETATPTTCTLCLQDTNVARPTAPDARYPITTYGDTMGDTQHLVDHMLDGVLPTGLVPAALSAQGYLPHPNHGWATIRRTLRTYLANRLYVGATTPAHGKRPVLAQAS
jgi:hypothetical protein